MSPLWYTPELLATVERQLFERVQTRWSDSVVSLGLRRDKSFIFVSVLWTGKAECEPLLRLRFLGGANRWEFALYRSSLGVNRGYRSIFLPDGRIEGTAQECLDCALELRLSKARLE